MAAVLDADDEILPMKFHSMTWGAGRRCELSEAEVKALIERGKADGVQPVDL